MAAEDVKLELKLNDGRGKAIVMTSDLGYRYVQVNAEYSRPVATIATPSRGTAARPSSSTALISSLLPERTPEDDAWLLVLVASRLAQASAQ